METHMNYSEMGFGLGSWGQEACRALCNIKQVSQYQQNEIKWGLGSRLLGTPALSAKFVKMYTFSRVKLKEGWA